MSLLLLVLRCLILPNMMVGLIINKEKLLLGGVKERKSFGLIPD